MNTWFLCTIAVGVLAGVLAWLFWKSHRREQFWRETAHRLRQQLAKSEVQPWQLAVFEQHPDPLIVVNAQGHIVAINQQARRLFGEPRREGPLIFQLRHHAAAELFEEVMRTGQPAVHQIALEDGRIFQAHGWPWPLTNSPRGAILLLRDVTEQVHAIRARRELAANLGHELRTPLTSLKLLAETLIQSDLNDPELSRQLAGRVLDEVEAMTALVEDMISLAMIESGRVPLRLEPLPLADVVLERVKRIRPLADEKHITVEVDVPSDIVLALDRERFGQVITNLLDNAVKFTPSGGHVTVEAKRVNEHVRLTVRDTGPGIPPEALPHIFERFYKLDRARTRGEQRGTGIGLAIAKHLVQAHGGRIWAESRPGQGAVFIIELPVALTSASNAQ